MVLLALKVGLETAAPYLAFEKVEQKKKNEKEKRNKKEGFEMMANHPFAIHLI